MLFHTFEPDSSTISFIVIEIKSIKRYGPLRKALTVSPFLLSEVSFNFPLSVLLRSPVASVLHLLFTPFVFIFTEKLVYTPVWCVHCNFHIAFCIKQIAYQTFVLFPPRDQVNYTLECSDANHRTRRTFLPASFWNPSFSFPGYPALPRSMPSDPRLMSDHKQAHCSQYVP